MSPAGASPPSSSLPRLRYPHSLTESRLRTALGNLQTIYCPLRLPTGSIKPKRSQHTIIDSGYASEDETVEEQEDTLSTLRADDFERNFTVRWLTSLISRAEVLPFDDDVTSNIIDEASFILSSFSDSTNDETDDALFRDFSFPTQTSSTIDVRLKDAPLSGIDHTDVGLQSWGASIILSSLLCSEPDRFGLTSLQPHSNIIDLGAGTGLISLTLAKLLPHLSGVDPTITATDYHPAVLNNLQENIMMMGHAGCAPVKAAALDWTAPPMSLQSSIDLLIAADVVYASEHAVWLRNCATHLLAPRGWFWLMVTIRSNGKFEGISDTVEAAFPTNGCTRNGRVLTIVEKERIDKRRGVGRGDESGYMLFKIGWSSA